MGRPSLLHDVAFLRLWSATAASGLATWALPFILGLAVVDRTLTSTEIGTALAIRMVGFLVGVLIGGVMADRYSRRTVILVAGMAAAASTSLIAVGLQRSVLVVGVACAVVGAGQGACRPAIQALTAEIVDPVCRQQANAALVIATRVTVLVAPGMTAIAAIVMDVSELVVATGLFWIVTAMAAPHGSMHADVGRPVSSLFTELTEGAREAGRHPWFLAGLAALAAVVATGYSATGVALPLVSRDRYGTEAVFAGAITALPAGAVVGALLVARWQSRAQGWAALAGLACYGFAPLSLLVAAPPAWVIAAYATAGVGVSLFNVPWFTATQREIEPHLLARVASLDFLLSYGFSPIGLAAIGPAIDAFGTRTVLGTCAVTCFLAPSVAAFVPSSRTFRRVGTV